MASKSTAPLAWTVGDLGAFYTQHRAELHAHASRVLKDQIKAEEITQDAVIKFMLAPQSLNQKSTHFPIAPQRSGQKGAHAQPGIGADTLKPSIHPLPLPIP